MWRSNHGGQGPPIPPFRDPGLARGRKCWSGTIKDQASGGGGPPVQIFLSGNLLGVVSFFKNRARR